MIKKIISFVLAVSVVSSIFALGENVVLASDENLENLNAIIYIDDLDIYVTVGKTGTFSSVDGLEWAKRVKVGNNKNLLSIAWGGSEEDKKALIIESGNKDSIIKTDDFNGSEAVATIIGDEDAWDTLKLNTKIIWDEYSQKFYCGGLRYSDGVLSDMGLFWSTGEIKNGGSDYGMSNDLYMRWEKLELGEADVYADYLDNKAPFTDIETDNNGRMAIVVGRRLKNSDTDNGTAIIGSYIDRYIVFHDLRSEKTAGIKTSLQAPEIEFDDTGYLVAGAQVAATSTRQAVATYDFDAIMDTLDGISGLISNNGARIQESDGVGSKESNTNVVKNRYMKWAPKAYGVLENKNGEKFMVIVPKKGETTLPEDRHNDLGFIQYNPEGKLLKTKYYTFVNDDEALAELLGNGTDSPKTVVDSAVKPDRSEMVVLTQNDTFVIDAENINPAVTDPASQDALRNKFIKKGSGEVTSEISYVEFESEDIVELSANEEYVFDTVIYDINSDEAEAEWTVELLSDSDKAEEYFDISDIKNGVLKTKESFMGTEEVSLKVKIKTDTPSVFLVKTLRFSLKSDIEVLKNFEKTSGFSKGDTLSGVVKVTNNSSEIFDGYVIVYLKQGFKYIDFAVANVRVQPGESQKIEVSEILENEDYSDAVLEMSVIDNVNLFDVQ